MSAARLKTCICAPHSRFVKQKHISSDEQNVVSVFSVFFVEAKTHPVAAFRHPHAFGQRSQVSQHKLATKLFCLEVGVWRPVCWRHVVVQPKKKNQKKKPKIQQSGAARHEQRSCDKTNKHKHIRKQQQQQQQTRQRTKQTKQTIKQLTSRSPAQMT